MLNDCNNPAVFTGRHKFHFDQMFDDYIFLILKWHKAEKKEENITPQMEIHQKVTMPPQMPVAALFRVV